MTESLQRDTLVEAVVLCLGDWRGRILAGRSEKSWVGPPELLSGVRHNVHAFHFVRDIFDYLSMRGSALASAFALHNPERARDLPPRLRFALTASRMIGFGSNVVHVRLVKAAMRRYLAPLLAWGEPRELSRDLGEELARGAEVEIHWFARDYIEHLMRVVSAPGVTHVTLDPARAFPDLDAWTMDTVTGEAVERLSGLLHACALYRVTLTLQVRTYVEAMVAPDIVEAICSAEEHRRVRLGMEVLAELPESGDILARLYDLAEQRTAQGGAPIEVRLSTRSITSPESVRAIEQGLPVPTLSSRQERDANWFALADRLLRRETIRSLRPVIATEDAVLLAAARVLAERRDVGDLLTFALRRGVAPELQAALTRSGVRVRVLAITLGDDDYPYGLPPLLDILYDVLHETSAFADADELFAEDWALALDAHDHVRARLARLLSTPPDELPRTHRVQDRAREWEMAREPHQYRLPTETVQFDTGGLTAAVMRLTPDADQVRVRVDDRSQSIPVVSSSGFANEPDTDAVQARNRDWFRRCVDDATAVRSRDVDPGQRSDWHTFEHRERGTLLRRAALAIAAARDRFTGNLSFAQHLPAEEVDHEISFAIDSARFLASRADSLRVVRGAAFEPVRLTLVALDEATPFGIAAEHIFASLAAGSDVVALSPERNAQALSILAEELEAAGLPTGALRIVVPGPKELFEDAVLRLVEHDEIDRGVFSVRPDLVERIVKRRPGLQRDVRPRGIGTIVLSSTSDFTEHISHIVRSAFTQAGTHPRAARALIIIDTFGPSKRVLAALADAVRARRPGEGTTGNMACLRSAPNDATFRALTELAPGESWLVEPKQLDAEGIRWSPGVRVGVRPDAQFWADALEAPVIGVTTAATLDEAIKRQHAIGAGHVAGLMSLDQAEIKHWLDATRAAALVVNRPTTFARVERHPIGVWGNAHSSVQPMIGTPDRLTALGNWTLRVGTPSETLHLRGLDPIVTLMIEASQPSLTYDEFDMVRRAALADALAWRTQYGLASDIPQLSTEENRLRYLTVPVHVRIAEDANLVHAVRVLAAGHLTNAPLTLSTGMELPARLRELLDAQMIPVVSESDTEWIERASREGGAVSGALEMSAERIRLIGGDPIQASEWLSTNQEVGVLGGPVTMAGPVELLTFLRPQAITIATTRHGYRAPLDAIPREISVFSATGVS